MPFDEARADGPLFSKSTNRRPHQPHRQKGEPHSEHGKGYSGLSSKGLHWGQEWPPRRLKPHQKISAHLQEDSECSETIALRLALFWRPFAEQENSRKKNPAQDHAEQRGKCKWGWIGHGMRILPALLGLCR